MMEGMVCVLCLQSDVGFAIDEGTKSAEKGETWGGRVLTWSGGTGNARLSVTASKGHEYSFSCWSEQCLGKWAPWGLHYF